MLPGVSGMLAQSLSPFSPLGFLLAIEKVVRLRVHVLLIVTLLAAVLVLQGPALFLLAVVLIIFALGILALGTVWIAVFLIVLLSIVGLVLPGTRLAAPPLFLEVFDLSVPAVPL